MDDQKENKGFWRSWMTITILAALAIMTVFLFSSQSPYVPSFQNGNISMNNGTNVKGSVNIIENSTNAMDNDTFFKSDVKVNIGIISENLQCISNAGRTKNFTQIERCGQFLSENANISLSHASGYKVSHPLQIPLNEYKKALGYYNIGGTKLVIGAKNRDLSQMGDAIGYIQNGTARFDMVASALYGNELYSAASNRTNNTVSNANNATFAHPKVTGTVGSR